MKTGVLAAVSASTEMGGGGDLINRSLLRSARDDKPGPPSGRQGPQPWSDIRFSRLTRRRGSVTLSTTSSDLRTAAVNMD